MSEVKVTDSLDLKDIPCPLNFVKTKLKLEVLNAGQVLEIIIDDGEPIQNIPRAIKEEGHKILHIEKLPNKSYKLLIEKDGGLKNGR